MFKSGDIVRPTTTRRYRNPNTILKTNKCYVVLEVSVASNILFGYVLIAELLTLEPITWFRADGFILV
jgi:hypothetical protein